MIRSDPPTGAPRRFGSARPTPRKPARGRDAGFTLIELVVVVAIIGLLLTILLPVNAAARDSARQLQCGVQLQQIAVGIMGHTIDHHGQLPGRARRGVWLHSDYVTTGRPPDKNLPYHLDNYLGTNTRQADRYGSIEIDEAVWRCPANDDALERPAPHAYINNQQSNTQAPYFFGSFSDFANLEQARPKRLDEVRSGGVSAADPIDVRPARSLSSIWMMGDIDFHNYSNFGWLRGVDPPHAGRTARNYSFFDGHLETRRILGAQADPPINP